MRRIGPDVLELFYKKSNILGHGSTHQAPSCGQIYWVGFVFPSSSKDKGQEPLGKRLSVCSARLQVLCLTLENTTATHNPSLTDRFTKQRQEHKNRALCCKKNKKKTTKKVKRRYKEFFFTS